MPQPTAAMLDRIRVVLVRPSHPGNIGAAARAMWTMGLARLVLVAPKRLPDAEATALARGAACVLDRADIVDTLEAALAGCTLAIGLSARPREFAGRVLPVREVASLAAAEAPRGEVAFVFGTEMSGLSNEELARCSIAATIPANPEYSSLNLAAAVQLVGYEARIATMGGELRRATRFPAASLEAIEGLLRHAERTLVAMRFLDLRRPRRLLPRLRRLFSRAGLEREEVNILRGILARIDELIAARPPGER